MSKAYIRSELRTILDPSPATCLLARGWTIGIVVMGIVLVLLLGVVCESLVMVNGKPFAAVRHSPIPFFLPYAFVASGWGIRRPSIAVVFAVTVLVLGEVMIGLVVLSECLQPIGFRQVLLPSSYLIFLLLMPQLFSGFACLVTALHDYATSTTTKETNVGAHR